MLRAMVTPRRGIGDTAVREFDEYCFLVEQLWEELSPHTTKPSPLEVLFHLSGDDSWCSWENAEFPPPSVALSTRTLKNLTTFAKQMVSIRNRANVAPVEQVLSAIVNDMQLIPHLDKISKSVEEFEERKANVQELQQASQKYTKDGACLPQSVTNVDENSFGQSPLGSFLDDVALVTDMADDAQRSKEERLVVSLMTIHASKGMEFDSVFFVGIEDGTVPSSQVSFIVEPV
jgi:superfamily I DNA/RNA helicase